MAALSQIQASLVSAQNQNTLALANFNLDFSLVKVSAAEEYQGLGTALSQRRRENAEEGPLHRTARKLGALFEQVIPQIYELSEAYGRRVSEIVEHSNAESKTENDYGAFASHIGLDGTSIYAAATSGPKVIALHLLACMLARAWSGPEATAIWVELVEFRKSEVEKNSDPSHLHGLLARTIAQQEISRSQLAAWDASARAWLRSADEVKRFEQTQLRLIIKDSGLSLDTSGTTYENVMDAWLMAMTGLQKLILGIPQNISKASILLGLLSWHIYPDLIVVNPVTQVTFSDRFVKQGGVLTLGLSRDGLDKGVRWSLALSHLRFYGDPVPVEKYIGSDNGRLTIPELHLVTLGCVISSWIDSYEVDPMAAADCFLALDECVHVDDLDPGDGPYSPILWLRILVSAAKDLTRSTGVERQHCVGLIEFGRRRGRNFLDGRLLSCTPMFGLADSEILGAISTNFAEQDIDSAVTALRGLAELCDLDRDDCIIRYIPHDPLDQDPEYQAEVGSKMLPEYTTAIPHETSTMKHDREGGLISNQRHTYWVYIDSRARPEDQIFSELLDNCEERAEAIEKGRLRSQLDLKYELEAMAKFRKDPGIRSTWRMIPEFSGCTCDSLCHLDNLGNVNCPCALRKLHCTSLCTCVRFEYRSLSGDLTCANLRPRRAQLIDRGSSCHWISPRDSNLAERTDHRRLWWYDPPLAFAARYREDNDYMEADLWEEDADSLFDFDFNKRVKGTDITDHDYSTSCGGHASFRYFAGDPQAALFLSKNAPRLRSPQMIKCLSTRLRSNSVIRERLVHYLLHIRSQPDSSCYHVNVDAHELFFNSLDAIAKASRLYSYWEQATVSIDITKRPIGDARWATRFQHITDFSSPAPWILRSSKFACIAMLETGVDDLHPYQLGSVFAMASGNSLYVAESLLQDPSKLDRSGMSDFVGIRRVLGNLDRPGIVMLVPPQKSRIRQPDLNYWKLVQQNPYDGLATNAFKNTSLHLSFTEFELPIAIETGAFDPEISLLEAFISVHEGREWVADLDILRSVAGEGRGYCNPCDDCARDPASSNALGQLLAANSRGRLKSIGNWDELLCSSDNLISTEIGVVRASNSWIPRLAAASICKMQGHRYFSAPSRSICRRCSEVICKWVLSDKPFIIIA